MTLSKGPRRARRPGVGQQRPARRVADRYPRGRRDAGGAHARRLHHRQVHPRLRRTGVLADGDRRADLLRAVGLPVVRAVGARPPPSGGPPPSVRRYAWHRVRRIMPAYVVTVLVAYLLYHFRTAGPNPGHTWMGLFRNLTLTQIYTDNYLYLLSAPRPYADVEPGGRGRVLRGAAAAGVPAAGGVVPPAVAAGAAAGGAGGAGVDHAGVAGPGAHHRLPARRGAAVAADVSRRGSSAA